MLETLKLENKNGLEEIHDTGKKQSYQDLSFIERGKESVFELQI